MMSMIKNLNMNVQKIFLLIGLFWGFVFLIINPPFQAPDEDAHLYKMWGFLNGTSSFQILNGHKGLYMPKSFAVLDNELYVMKFDYNSKIKPEKILELKDVKLDKEDVLFFEHVPTAYSILSYIPAIFVLGVLKFLNVPPLLMMYILRFCCLLTYLAIIYQAIKLTPYKKWLFCILALLPVNLYIAGAVNTDCLVISIAFYFTAYTFYLKFSENVQKISTKQIFIWGLLFTIICLLKYLYFPMIFLFFLLPKDKFNSAKNYYMSFAVIALINLIHIISYLAITLSVMNVATDQNIRTVNARSSLMKLIVSSPHKFIFALIYSTVVKFHHFFLSCISQFGWKPFFMKDFYSIIFYIIIFISLFFKDNNFSLKKSDKYIIALTVTILYFLTLSSISILYGLYPLISGWQGRYFSPEVVLFFLLFTPKTISIKNYNILFISIIIMQFLYLHACLRIIGRFYIF